MSNKDNWSGRNKDKDRLRNNIWQSLIDNGVAKGEVFHNIPDFVGSKEAAALLRSLPEWKVSKYMMCSPDVPQIPVRYNALVDNMVVYMAVPQLKDERCFVELEKEAILNKGMSLEEAATWEGALKVGRYVTFEEMEKVDITVTGCVAATRTGGRTGKGAGFADIEYALMRRYKKIEDTTPIITTVHPLMIVDESLLPLQEHDTYLTMVITPDEVIRTNVTKKQPQLNWSLVRADQIESIPILRRLKEEDGL